MSYRNFPRSRVASDERTTQNMTAWRQGKERQELLEKIDSMSAGTLVFANGVAGTVTRVEKSRLTIFVSHDGGRSATAYSASVVEKR